MNGRGRIPGIENRWIDAIFSKGEKFSEVVGKRWIEGHASFDFYRSQLSIIVQNKIDFIPPLHTEIIKFRLLFSCVVTSFQCFHNNHIFEQAAKKRVAGNLRHSFDSEQKGGKTNISEEYFGSLD